MAAGTILKEAKKKAMQNAEPLAGGPSPALQEKFRVARDGVSNALIERDEDVHLLYVALIAGDHALLVGEPGTAKSQMIDGMVGTISDATKFDILMSKFTDPVETEGPLNVGKLLEGSYTRQNAGYMTQAHVIFMDEVFKASSAILNTTLKLINERKYRNGGQWHESPLISLYGASNEYPVGDGYADVAHAFFDRFLFRKTVKPVSTQGARKLMFAADSDLAPPRGGLTVDEVNVARKEAAEMPVDKAVPDALCDILRLLAEQGIVPGDRRKRKAVKAARAHAWLSGASELAVEHLDILQHVLWVDPQEQPRKCAEIVQKAANPEGHALNDLIAQAHEIAVEAQKALDAGKSDVSKMTQFFVEIKKFKDVASGLKRLNQNNPKVKQAAEWAIDEIKRLSYAQVGLSE